MGSYNVGLKEEIMIKDSAVHIVCLHINQIHGNRLVLDEFEACLFAQINAHLHSNIQIHHVKVLSELVLQHATIIRVGL